MITTILMITIHKNNIHITDSSSNKNPSVLGGLKLRVPKAANAVLKAMVQTNLTAAESWLQSMPQKKLSPNLGPDLDPTQCRPLTCHSPEWNKDLVV